MTKFFYFLYRFLYKMGYVVLTFSILVLLSMGIVSYKLKNETSKNPYCYLESQNINIPIEHEKIIGLSYKIDCNTINLEIELENDLSEDEIITVLLDIKQQLEDNNIFYRTHVIVSCNTLKSYLFVSLNLGEEGIFFIGN